MRHRTAGIRPGLAAIVFASASPALPQAWIGQMYAENAQRMAPGPCRHADPPPAENVAAVRTPALAVMRTYWEHASAADAADVSAAFHVRHAFWVSGLAMHGGESLTSINDRMARQPGAQLVPEPSSFVLASDGRSARGLWRVEQAGAPIGYYLGDFGSDHHVWKLVNLRVTDALPDRGLTQYCHQPGDFEDYLAAQARRQTRRDAQQAAQTASGTAPR